MMLYNTGVYKMRQVSLTFAQAAFYARRAFSLKNKKDRFALRGLIRWSTRRYSLTTEELTRLKKLA